ncbi:MAG TPA: ABC transporter ATP-binding protein, partial [Actinomycetes bacterium]|nr:ABC transporter ATP-binding protein [Actinomycetes bacterium]
MSGRSRGTLRSGPAGRRLTAPVSTYGAPPEPDRDRRDRRAGRRARAWLWPLVRPHRGLVVLASLAVLVQTGASLAMPYLVKVAIDQGVTPRDLAVLNRVALAYLVLAGVQFLAGRVEVRTVARAGQRVLLSVRTRLFRHLQTLSLDFYERERTGRLVARMTSDIDAMSDLVTDGLVTLVTALITMVGVAVILVVMDWQLALATLVVAPLIGLAASFWRRWSADAYRQVRETHSVVTVQLQESLAGVRAIQSFRRERASAGNLREANHAERAAHRRTIALASFFFPGIEFLGTVATVVVLGLGGRRVLSGELEIGTLAAFLLYLRNLFDPVQQLSELYDSFQSATAGAERVGSVLAERPSVREAPHPVPLPDPRGDVRLEDVRFAYDQGPEVLHDVDLRVDAGATLALIGPTGAGKSTVAKLIARFYDPQGGRVTLDGVDLRQVRLADLRRAMGYVPQEGFLFSGTVLDNIRFGRPEATRAEVEAAAWAVGADQVIAGLPDGYDTQVGERGALLAAGERQLVAFARAWIADPALLILDEATSNLDAASEARITDALQRLRSGRTTIIIAHRLSTVAQADQIAVVEDGRIVESGPPAALRAHGGRFAELFDRWV